jgi:predicted unusual protein kinase regulating ubiquinone biosynthesis (AarF/ABC1/UbiB family)
MARFFEGLNSKNRLTSGWTFAVPKVDETALMDDFLMTDYVDGVSFDEMKASPEKKTAGEAIFRSMIYGLIEKGAFEPDRHNKNIKINPQKKSIYMLDPGQFRQFSKSLLPFKSDDRTVIAEFFVAVAQNNLPLLLESIARMSHTESQKLPASFRQDVQKILKADEGDMVVKVSNLVKSILRHRVQMDFKFSFTALKGLIVLIKENYVPWSEAEGIIRESLVRLLITKGEVGFLHEIYKANQIQKKSCQKMVNP